MEAASQNPALNPTAVYDRVLREARQSFGDVLGDEEVVTAAHEAVDEYLVNRQARVRTFVPVLAMRRIRESVDLLVQQVENSNKASDF